MVTLVGSLAPLAILNAANTTQLSLLLTKAVPASHLAISIPGPELEAIPDTLHANRRQAGGVGMELGWLAVEFGSVGFGRDEGNQLGTSLPSFAMARRCGPSSSDLSRS